MSTFGTRLARGAMACVAALTVSLGSAVPQVIAAPDGPDTPVATSPSGTPNHDTMLGDFAAPVWLPMGDDGVKHIDIDATLDALEEANVNTYAYILSGAPWYGDGETDRGTISATQWAEFPAFADAAAERNIDVYLYMSGPSGSALDPSVPRPEQQPGNKPYGWDYIAWAEETARLAVDHPNIGGLIIDDFDTNTPQRHSPWSFVFTPDYVRQMSSAAKALSPEFTIHGVVYQPAMDVGSAFRGALDGVIFPYRGETSTPGTSDASSARAEGEVYGDLAHCASDRCLQFHGDGSSTDGAAAGVSRQIAVTGGGEHRLTMKVNNDNYRNPCEDGRCFEFSMPGHHPTASGDHVAISQTVEVSGDGPAELSFFLGDSNRRMVTGYHFVEALIDGEVVARRDLAGVEEAGRIAVDVTDQVAGKSEVELTLRLFDEQGVTNFGITAWVDDVALTGATIADASFDDRDSGAWQESRVGEQMSALYTAGAYVLETVINGEVVATHAIEGYQGWSEVTQDLTAPLSGRSEAALEVRLRVADGSERTARTVWVDDLAIEGTNATAVNFDEADWVFHQGGDLQALQVASFDTVWMVYASRLSSDPPGHQPSADYIAEVQEVGLDLMQEGLFDGSLIYVLNLSDPVTSAAGEERARIGELYGDYAATDLASCDTVLRGRQHDLTVTDGRTCLVGGTALGPTVVADTAELVAVDATFRGSVTVDGGAVALCGSRVAGTVTVRDAREVRFGATTSLCAGNTVSGSATVAGTSSTLVVAALTLRGALSCSDNVALDQRGTTSTIDGSASGDCAVLAG